MLTENNLQELLTYQATAPVLSVYLNTDPKEGSADGYRLNLRNMFKSVDLPQDVAVVERYFEHEFDWSGRSVVVFSCAADKFFRAYSLAIPIRNRVRVSSHPHVKPLANLLDFYGGYGVALVDKQGARFFYFHLGELIEQEGVMGEAVRKTKRGGASTFPGRRGGMAGQTNYTEEVTERNMKEAVNFATHFFKEYKVRRVLISGADDNVALFRSLLPKSWQSLVVGSFHIGMTASKDEVLQRAMEIGKQAEISQKDRLVEALITNAAKKRGGVIGLEETLKAVHEGRVQTLVLKEGFRAPGYQCSGCSFLTAHPSENCPYCGGIFHNIPDAVELAVRTIMQQGSEVEVLHSEQTAEKVGKIGAILRY